MEFSPASTSTLKKSSIRLFLFLLNHRQLSIAWSTAGAMRRDERNFMFLREDDSGFKM
jgi:hypothetical protein